MIGILYKIRSLENLFKVKKYRNWALPNNINEISATVYKIGSFKISILTVATSENSGKIEIPFPEQYSANPFISVTDNDLNSNNLAYSNISIGWASHSSVTIKGYTDTFKLIVIGDD